jgi:hypothetical protein
MRSIALNGMQKFIIPRASPMQSSKLINTTTSFGGTICTNCGLLSTRSIERSNSSTFSQACFISLQNRSVIRETSRSSISVSGRRTTVPESLLPPKSRSIMGNKSDRLMSRISWPSSGAALTRLKQVGFSRLNTNSL